jgi:hypothetical protein
MAADRLWSMSWSEKSGQFLVRFRKTLPQAGEDRWGLKRIPKQFLRYQELDAERWFMSWYAAHVQTGGLNARAIDVRG